MKFSCLESLMDYLKHIKFVKGSFFLLLNDQNLGKIVDFLPCNKCKTEFDCVLFLKENHNDLCLPVRLYYTGYDVQDFDVKTLENKVILELFKKDNFKLIKKLTFK